MSRCAHSEFILRLFDFFACNQYVIYGNIVDVLRLCFGSVVYFRCVCEKSYQKLCANLIGDSTKCHNEIPLLILNGSLIYVSDIHSTLPKSNLDCRWKRLNTPVFNVILKLRKQEEQLDLKQQLSSNMVTPLTNDHC